jgi:uncharacterized protein
MFESSEKLILGFVTGLVFGFLLQKGQVAKYPVIMGQFLLRDFTVVKIMGTAVAVGSVGIHFMHSIGMIHLEIKPAALAPVIAGAMLFGIGISIFGLCPGTSVAACGEGNRGAMIGALGMLSGAFVYVMSFATIKELGKGMADWGKVTIPQITNTSPWVWVGALGAAGILWYSIEKIINRSHNSSV